MGKPTTSSDPVAVFEAKLRKIVFVPKKAIDRKIEAFKQPKWESRSR